MSVHLVQVSRSIWEVLFWLVKGPNIRRWSPATIRELEPRIGGDAAIPTPFGANPTRTSMRLAIRAAFEISPGFGKRNGLTSALLLSYSCRSLSLG